MRQVLYCQGNSTARKREVNALKYPSNSTPLVSCFACVGLGSLVMTRCTLCEGLNVELLDDNDMEFHKDISSLKESAESGCDFCNLCWGRIQSDWPKRVLDACLQGKAPPVDPSGPQPPPWVPQMWLRGYIYYRKSHLRRVRGESRIWLSCGRLYEDNVGQGLALSLSLFAAPGTPAALRFHGRMSTRNRNPEAAIPMVRNWLHMCRNGIGPNGHKLCNFNIKDDMPTRVIDIGSKPHDTNSAHLIITDGLREPYMALSYCWGPGAKSALKLTRENLSSLTHSLPRHELSAAHRDTLQIAGELGIRYVWIDALCIIQGDTEDWEYESQRMGRVYGNALLTVIAGRSGDSGQGFIENNLDQKQSPCPLPLEPPTEGVDNSGLFVCLPRLKTHGPVSDRAWCFQELHLSRRFLVYGEEQLIFRCREQSLLEDGGTNDSQPAGVAITAGPSADLRRSMLLGATTPGPPPIQRERVLNEWYLLLKEYTRRELSNPHDIFAALSGVAQLAGQTLKSRYLAGIWEADMVRGLLWKSCHQIQSDGISWKRLGWPPVTRPKPTFLAPEPVRRAPSWSWAAVQGPTVHVFRLRTRHSAEKMVVHPKHTNPDRWTTHEGCDINVLYMPWCELQVIGCLKALQVMRSRDVSHYLTEEKRWTTYDKYKMIKYGVLLEPLAGEASTQAGVGQVESLVAIGVFDIADEAVSVVCCLRLFEDEGLMLVQAGEGKYARAGWFTVENREWFEQGEEVEVALV